MSAAKRKRDVPVLFWVSAEEMNLIRQKMEQIGTGNLSAYLRKMAMDGYTIKLDLPELKEWRVAIIHDSDTSGKSAGKKEKRSEVAAKNAVPPDPNGANCPVRKVWKVG